MAAATSFTDGCVVPALEALTSTDLEHWLHIVSAGFAGLATGLVIVVASTRHRRRLPPSSSWPAPPRQRSPGV